MQQAIDTFKLNIDSVKQLDAIYQYLEQHNLHKTLDLSEILRAEIVLAVSALDCFISDALHIGLVKTFEGNRVLPTELTKSFNEFQVDMKTLIEIVNAPSPSDKSLALGNYIRKINSKNPYQDPKQIENALLLLGIKQIWTKLGTAMSITGTEVKAELANIVWQRHKIAHEADFDYLTQRKRPRDRVSTFQAIEFIEKLCIAIHNIVISEIV
jgi:hypothetical protein